MRTPMMPVAFAILLSICTFFGPLTAKTHAATGELTGYFTVQSFDWKEFVDESRAVRETGPLFGIGVMYPLDLGGRVSFRPSAEIFGGVVDYDGHACDVFGESCEAASTDVNYFGVQLQADLGRSFGEKSAYLEPFAGLGFRYWQRNINEGSTASGTPVSDFTEDWISLYLRGGLRGGVALSGRNQLFYQAGAKLPVFTQNTAYTSRVGNGNDLNLRPGKQVSFFGEAGVEFDRLSVSVFYDSFRFPQSPSVSDGFSIGYQPRSTMDLYGLRLGWTF